MRELIVLVVLAVIAAVVYETTQYNSPDEGAKDDLQK